MEQCTSDLNQMPHGLMVRPYIQFIPLLQPFMAAVGPSCHGYGVLAGVAKPRLVPLGAPRFMVKRINAQIRTHTGLFSRYRFIQTSVQTHTWFPSYTYMLALSQPHLSSCACVCLCVQVCNLECLWYYSHQLHAFKAIIIQKLQEKRQMHSLLCSADVAFKLHTEVE